MPEPMTIDFELFRRSLVDGTALKILEAEGRLSVDAMLKRQGDEITWDAMERGERYTILSVIEPFADILTRKVEYDERHCVVV